MKIEELKTGDEIVFLNKDWTGITDNEEHEFGNISFIDLKNKILGVTYLQGLKSASEVVSFNKVIAKGDTVNGVMMDFRTVKGKSILIEQ